MLKKSFTRSQLLFPQFCVKKSIIQTKLVATSQVFKIDTEKCSSAHHIHTKAFEQNKVLLAGHNKWSKIRHHKADQDSKRSKLTSKICREIMSSVRLGGADPNVNLRLRFALETARKNNVTRDKIDGAIKSGLNSKDGLTLDTITYEGYGPAGVGFIVQCVTDNRNRTASSIRNLFAKHGGSLSGPGAVSYNFDNKGLITISDLSLLDKVTEFAIEEGAEDVLKENGVIVVLSDPTEVHKLKEALEKKGIATEGMELVMRPKMSNVVSRDSEAGSQLEEFIDALEDLDDTQTIFHSAVWGEEAQ